MSENISLEEIKKIWPSSAPDISNINKYVEKYKSETIVIKYGGNVLIDRSIFNNFIEDIGILNKLGLSIVVVHGGGPRIKRELVNEELEIFFDLRKIPGLKKKPSTSELIDWLKLLLSDDMPDEILKNADSSKAIPPLYGALLKNEQDVQLLERLAFMSRREAANK